MSTFTQYLQKRPHDYKVKVAGALPSCSTRMETALQKFELAKMLVKNTITECALDFPS